MQIIQSKSNFVEKVLRDKEGRLVRATFQVYENAGRIKARLVDFVYINTEALVGKIFKLAEAIKRKISEFSKVLNFVFNPPNYSLGTIYSLGSKPRAPTF